MIKALQRTLLIFALTLGTASAASIPFDQANFDQLLAQGKPVVLHIHADWCLVCKAQQAVLDELLPTQEFNNLPVLRVNFDKETSLLRAYRVRNQSTFIVLHNGKEVIRSTGETDRDKIAALLKRAM